MATVIKMDNGEVKSDLAVIAPPADEKFETQDKLLLVLEVLWLSILTVPHVLLAAFRSVFPPAGKPLRGQVVLVTGAGRGLGKGLALRLAREGCKVAVADINRANAEDTAAEIVRDGGTAKAYFTNVAKVSEVKGLQEDITRDLGPVDILINNAGLLFIESLERSRVEDITTTIAVNLTSHFWTVQEFLPAMKKRNSGHIVAIASLAGLMGLANETAYAATKFGVRGFMEALRADLETEKGNKIKTTTVFPYFINTSATYLENWEARLPMLSIEEVVDAVVNGIKRDRVTVSIPGYFYFLMHFVRLLPLYIMDKSTEIFYAKVFPVNNALRDLIVPPVLKRDLAKEDTKLIDSSIGHY